MKCCRNILIAFVLIASCGLAANALDVTVRTVRDQKIVGELVALSRDRGVSMVLASNGSRVDMPMTDIVGIAFENDESATNDNNEKTSPHVLVASNGDRFIGMPGSFADDHVGMRLQAGGEVRLPLDNIHVWVTRSDAGTEKIIQRVAKMLANGDDVLLLKNGDNLSGIVISADWEGFELEMDDAVVRMSHDTVLAAGIVTEPAPQPSRMNGVIQLVNGSEFRADDWLLSSNQNVEHLQVRLTSGAMMKIDESSLQSLSVINGRWKWLSEIPPIDVEQTPMMDIAWNYGLDENVLGQPLQTAGKSFERGIGVHSRSVLTYELDGAYESFVTHLGMDDSGGPMSNVDASIVVDGSPVFEQANIRRGRLFGPVRIPLKGKQRLSLVVDFGAYGGIQDRFNWIESALIKAAD